MKVGDKVVLEYRMASTHYFPGKITEITPGKRIATVRLDTKPNFLTTRTLRVETKYLFVRWRPL